MKSGSILPAIAVATMFSITANAQKPAAFIKGGVNFANISISDNGGTDDNKMLVGFHVGFQGDLPIAPVLSIQPGVFFTTKGSKTQSGNPTDADYFKATTNPMYIEVPVNVVFKAPVGEQSKFYVGAGPYIAMGIAGKNKVDYKISNASFHSEKNIEWSNDNNSSDPLVNLGYSTIRRFDYGLNGTVGVEGNKAIVSVNYGYGLAKLRPNSDNSVDDKNKHRVISVTVGFKL
ncbi:MAG: PorT family protein [Bacteroidetes bacterium]|nr:PorT family protein [Bacteroidota bacterium]